MLQSAVNDAGARAADLSTNIALSNITGFTYDDVGGLFYITTYDGLLHRWNPITGSFLSSVDLGGFLTSVDVTPDGKTVVVGQENPTPAGSAQVDLYTIGTGAISSVPVTLSGTTAISDVAVAGPSMAIVSGGLPQFGGRAAALSLKSPHAATTIDGLYYSGPYLIPSDHHRYVLMLTPGISDGPLQLYDSVAGKVTETNDLYALNTSGFNTGIADIADNAGLIIDIVSGNILVLNTQLHLVRDLTALGGAIFGAHFVTDGHQLLLRNAAAHSIDAYDTTSWHKVGSIPLPSFGPEPLSPTVNMVSGEQNGMEVSLDGRWLFMATVGGIQVIDLFANLHLNVAGDAFANDLYGSAGSDVLSGGDGADTLHGMGGADAFSGGAGNDLMIGGAGNDSFDGGTGVDAVSYETATAGVHVSLLTAASQNTVGAGTDTLISIEKLVGSAFADTLIAGAGGSTLNGGNGGDDLFSGPGSDILNGGGASDFADYALATGGVTVSLAVSGFQNTFSAGHDELVGIEKLVGSAYGDSLTGDAGANALYGVGGNDVLTGGGGQDTLAGGAGLDLFIFQSVTDSTVAAPDTILDFQAGEKIDLSAIDANTALAGDQDFHLGATPGHAGDIVVGPFTGGHTLVSLYVDGDATPDAAILLNGDHHGLTAADFVL